MAVNTKHKAVVTLKDRIPSDELLHRYSEGYKCAKVEMVWSCCEKEEHRSVGKSVQYGSCCEKATGKTEEDMDELCGTGPLQSQCDQRRCAGSPKL